MTITIIANNNKQSNPKNIKLPICVVYNCTNIYFKIALKNVIGIIKYKLIAAIAVIVNPGNTFMSPIQ